jgi:hypothetical protein
LSVKLFLQSEYRSSAEALRALAEEIERISNESFNPKSVPGFLLRKFDSAWPEHWSWADDPPLWGNADAGATPLVDSKFYDLSEWDLCFDDQPMISIPLERFVLAFVGGIPYPHPTDAGSLTPGDTEKKV